MTIDHITLRVSNLERSKKFYSNALKVFGYVLAVEKETSAGFCRGNKRDIWIVEGNAGQAIHSFGCLAFGASSKQMVDDFYRAALEAGGKDNGGPGYRKQYHAGYYAAFVLDPDGHNIEAIYDDPDAAGWKLELKT